MASDKNVWAVIPAYNEEKRVGSVVEKVKKYIDNIVVIDDGSKDDTGKIANKAGAFVLLRNVTLPILDQLASVDNDIAPASEAATPSTIAPDRSGISVV